MKSFMKIVSEVFSSRDLDLVLNCFTLESFSFRENSARAGVNKKSSMI